jgi:predicted HicB family RNase H-like nuclease
MEKQKKPVDTPLTVRFPPLVLEQMRVLAQEHHRSFNGEVITALETYIKQQQRTQKGV